VDPAEGTPPGEPQGSLLGDVWRSTPLAWKAAGALALAGLAAWGLWTLWDGHRRKALAGRIQAVLATLPKPAPDPFVDDEENAAVLYREAFQSVVFAKSDQALYVAFSGKKWKDPPKEVEAAVEAHEETLRLFEEALARPVFVPVDVTRLFAQGRTGSCYELAQIAAMRGLVAARAGRPGEGVHFGLLLFSMARQQGPGRTHPWFFGLHWDIHGPRQVLDEAVVHPGLDEAGAREILNRAMSGDEARAFYAASFEALSVRMQGTSMADWLDGSGEAKARAQGWKPPSFKQRLLAGVGKRPGGYSPFPSTGDFERQWDATMAARATLDARGRSAAEALVGSRPQWREGAPYDWAAHNAASLRGEFTVEAWLDTLRTAAALRLFEIRRGRAPASLDELVPDFLAAVPRDPFTGGPLRYETRSDGWTVSSAGPPGLWECNVPWNDLNAGITWKRTTPADPKPK
jgi:hypothetical protein